MLNAGRFSKSVSIFFFCSRTRVAFAALSHPLVLFLHKPCFTSPDLVYAVQGKSNALFISFVTPRTETASVSLSLLNFRYSKMTHTYCRKSAMTDSERRLTNMRSVNWVRWWWGNMQWAKEKTLVPRKRHSLSFCLSCAPRVIGYVQFIRIMMVEHLQQGDFAIWVCLLIYFTKTSWCPRYVMNAYYVSIFILCMCKMCAKVGKREH